jgi:DNA primase
MARRTPAHQREQHETREQRLAALRIRLHEVAHGIRTAEDWARCLRVAAQLPGETWPNVLLISSQQPAATLVKGYEAWRAAGRQVNRNERGIEIFSGSPQRQARHPTQDNDEQDHSFRDAPRVAYVWDLSQTSGQPLPAQPSIPLPPGELPPGLWDCLCWLARREGFAVERETGCPADGITLWTARRIRILPGIPDPQAVWALTHQLGHALLHTTITHPPGTTTTGCQGIQRNEADSVAFIICTRHGIPNEHAFPSPPTWAGTDPRAQPVAAILASGQRITAAATRINRYLDHYLPGRTINLAAPAETETADPVSSASLPPRPAGTLR